MLKKCVLLQSHLKKYAGGLASEVHVKEDPTRTLVDVGRREETNTTGSSRLKKNIENQFRKEVIQNGRGDKDGDGTLVVN